MQSAAGRAVWCDQMMHNSHIGMLVVDEARRMLFVNQRICRMVGYAAEELLHRSTEMLHLSYESFRRFEEIAIRSLRGGDAVSVDYPFRRKDGSMIWVHISGAANPEGGELFWTVVDITERIEAEKEAAVLRERMEMAIDANRDVVWDWDLVGGALYVSPAWREIIGHDNRKTPYEINIWRRHLHPEDRRGLFREINETIAGTRPYLDNTHRLRHHDGGWLWIHTRGKVLYDEEGQPIRMIGTHRNITETRELQQQTMRQAQIIEQIHDCVVSTDPEGTILTWNRGAQRLLGYAPSQIVGREITAIFHPGDHERMRNGMRLLEKKGGLHLEARLLTRSGEPILADLSVSLFRDDRGEIVGMIGYAQDITERKRAQEELLRQKRMLEYQATHDALTGLPNRLHFRRRLREEVARAGRMGERLALLFIDLDRFKTINDTWGHDIGDGVLRETGERLRRAVGKQGTVFRLGGDEFTVVLRPLTGREEAIDVARSIVRHLEIAVRFAKVKVSLSASIGIGIYPDDAGSEEALLRYADRGMYRQKKSEKKFSPVETERSGDGD